MTMGIRDVGHVISDIEVEIQALEVQKEVAEDNPDMLDVTPEYCEGKIAGLRYAKRQIETRTNR